MISSYIFEQLIDGISNNIFTLDEVVEDDLLEFYVVDDVLLAVSIASKYEITMHEKVRLGIGRRRYLPTPSQRESINKLMVLREI